MSNCPERRIKACFIRGENVGDEGTRARQIHMATRGPVDAVAGSVLDLC